MSFTIKGFRFTFQFLGGLFGFMGKGLAPAGKIFFQSIILPIYGRYVGLKSRVAKKTSGAREKFIYLFTNRYIIHILIALVALSVATSNLLAYENSENYGRGALINQLVQNEDFSTIEDMVDFGSPATVSSYQGEGALVANNFNESGQNITNENLSFAITQGGNTLMKPELASTEAAKIGRKSIREYIVVSGDAISSIAGKLNVSVETVLWANNLTVRSYIQPGQKLVIPPTSGVLHKIVKGDTVAKIAKKYQAAEKAIRDFNDINDASLAVGEIIMVPGGKIVTAPLPANYSTPTQISTVIPPLPAGSKMYWPNTCHHLTQYFRGWRHAGVDIACAYGSEIRAAQGGVVVRVQYLRYGYGYNVIIDHGGSKQTLYGHLSKILVATGQRVAGGQVIGLEGSTGRSTGPHLHFEIRINGAPVNPLNYVR